MKRHKIYEIELHDVIVILSRNKSKSKEKHVKTKKYQKSPKIQMQIMCYKRRNDEEFIQMIKIFIVSN